MQSEFLALAAKVFEQFFWRIIGRLFCAFAYKFVYLLPFFAAVLIPFSLAHPVHPTTAVPYDAVNYELFVGWWETAFIFIILWHNTCLVCRQSPKIFCIYLTYPLLFHYFCMFLWICRASAHHTFALFLWMIHTHWVLCWGWHEDDDSCIEEKFCTFLAKLFAAEFFVLFSFGLFFFPYVFPLSVDVRFFLKGSCFRVIDSGLSLMGSFTHSVKTGIYTL